MRERERGEGEGGRESAHTEQSRNIECSYSVIKLVAVALELPLLFSACCDSSLLLAAARLQ